MAKTEKPKPIVKTECEKGGDEILPVIIRVSKDDSLEWTQFVCKANADVRLFRRRLPDSAQDLLLHDSGKSKLSLRLDPLTPGDYLFRWIALSPSADWQMRTELKSNGTTLFRLRATATANKPMSGMGFVIVEVS